MNYSRKRCACSLPFVGCAVLLLGTIDVSAAPQEKKLEWRVPRRAARKKNEVPTDPKSIALGKTLFEKHCMSCHGPTGRGDGPAAKDLETQPGNLSDPKLWEQSDGAIFWKVKTGRTPMPSFLTLMSSTEQWNVVNYVRTLAPRPGVASPKPAGPKPLKAAISEVLKPYFEVVASLGSSDAEHAARSAKVLLDATKRLESADVRPLSDKRKAEWRSCVRALQSAATALERSSDLGHLRASLEPTSRSLVDVLSKFGHGERQPAYEFFCPHAMKGQGATWVQLGRKPRNPYMGAKMATCGKVRETLASSPAAVKKPQTGGSR